MAIDRPQGASWFRPMSAVEPPKPLSPTEAAQVEAAFAADNAKPLAERMMKNDWTIEHDAHAPFFSMRAVPSFDIEIRFPTRAVRHMMSPKEARDFANAILRAVRQAEKDRRTAEARHREQEG